ncbi:MAG: hypothetical protein WKF84_12640 [Pyrinomonadaceae bacterium]
MFSRNSKFIPALLLLLCCAATFSLSIAAGNKEVPPTRLPFEFNEQLVYEGEFSRLMLRNIDVVEMRFSSDRAPGQTASSDLPPNLLSLAR